MKIKIKLKDSTVTECPLRAEFMKNGTRFSFYPNVIVKRIHWLDSGRLSSKAPNFNLPMII